MANKIAELISMLIIAMVGGGMIGYISSFALDFTAETYEYWVTAFPLSIVWGYFVARNVIK